MWDLVAFLIDFVASSTPGRAVFALIPSAILGGIAYAVIPNKTVASYVFGLIVIAGLAIAVWWHFKDQKHDQQA